MNSLLLEPKLYGWQHLTYLAIFFVVLCAVIVATHFFIKTDFQKTVLLKVVAGILFVLIIMNRISVAFRFNSVTSFVPNSYCGMTSLLLSLFVLFGKPNMKVYNCLFYMGLVGGIATMFYPDFLGQDESFFYIPTISGLLHHSVLLILSILLVQTKSFTPSVKGSIWFPVVFSMYVLFGLFTMDIFNWGDAMSINSSLIDGTPLNWWFILLVGTALIYLVSYIYQLIVNKLKKKSTTTEQ